MAFSHREGTEPRIESFMEFDKKSSKDSNKGLAVKSVSDHSDKKKLRVDLLARHNKVNAEHFSSMQSEAAFR